MNLLWGIALLAGLLGAQAGLNLVWPAAPAFVDLLLLPPIWYGLARSQRSAMLAGAANGLMKDVWFQSGALGLSGFSRTLIGFFVGMLGTRFDLNNSMARFLVGFGAALVDSAITLLLLKLLDLDSTVAGIGVTLIRALVTGVLVAWGFMLFERFRNRRSARGRY